MKNKLKKSKYRLFRVEPSDRGLLPCYAELGEWVSYWLYSNFAFFYICVHFDLPKWLPIIPLVVTYLYFKYIGAIHGREGWED